MNAHGQACGFSLMELLVAMLAAMVLLLTASLLVFQAYAGWRSGRDAVELQRDASHALDVIGRLVREARLSDISHFAGGMAVGDASVYVSGDELIHDPDTAAPGDEMVLVAGRSVAWASSNAADRVSLFLIVGTGDDRVEVSSAFTVRN